MQTRAFVTRIRRRPTFPSFTLQPSPFPQGAAATDHHHHHLSFSFSPPTFDSPLLLHSASPEASLAFIEGAMSPFPPPPSQREGGLNGRTGETNRAASLFSDSSGTVRSVGVWGIRCIRARPISTRGGGFNSVFRRRNEREIRTKGEREGIDHEQARHAFKINYVREGVRNASPRLVAFDTTLETRYVVVYNEN